MIAKEYDEGFKPKRFKRPQHMIAKEYDEGFKPKRFKRPQHMIAKEYDEVYEFIHIDLSMRRSWIDV
jgi:hypothetical protein